MKKKKKKKKIVSAGGKRVKCKLAALKSFFTPMFSRSSDPRSVEQRFPFWKRRVRARNFKGYHHVRVHAYGWSYLLFLSFIATIFFASRWQRSLLQRGKASSRILGSFRKPSRQMMEDCRSVKDQLFDVGCTNVHYMFTFVVSFDFWVFFVCIYTKFSVAFIYSWAEV